MVWVAVTIEVGEEKFPKEKEQGGVTNKKGATGAGGAPFNAANWPAIRVEASLVETIREIGWEYEIGGCGVLMSLCEVE